MRTMDAIILRLEQRAIGVGGETIFAGADASLPGGPGPFVTVSETGGRPPIAAHNTTSLHQPSLQLVARGDLMPDVGTLVDQMHKIMGGDVGLSNILIGDVFFLYIRPTGEPFQLPNDAQGRVRLAFNINSMRR
jgi:hypothetical protein